MNMFNEISIIELGFWLLAISTTLVALFLYFRFVFQKTYEINNLDTSVFSLRNLFAFLLGYSWFTVIFMKSYSHQESLIYAIFPGIIFVVFQTCTQRLTASVLQKR